MHLTLQSPSHGDIGLIPETPRQSLEFVKPGAEILSVVVAFGDLLVQTFSTDDFTLLWNHFSLKEEISLNSTVSGACVHIVVAMRGGFSLKVPGRDEVHLKEWQFYLFYFPATASLTSLYKPGKEGAYFSLSLRREVFIDMVNALPAFSHSPKQIKKARKPERLFGPGIISPRTAAVIDEMFTDAIPAQYRHYLFQLRITGLMILLANEMNKSEDSSINNRDLEAILKAKDIIQHNITQPPSVRQLAIRVNMNMHKLKRLFKELTMETITEFILHRRLEYGRNLLLETKKTIKEIASLCGYKSTDSFTTAFRKMYNTTPDTLRRKSI